MTSMTKERAKELFEAAKENSRKRSECKRHSVSAFERNLGQRFTCSVCGCNADLSYVAAYADGYKAAGGNPNDIVPNYGG